MRLGMLSTSLSHCRWVAQKFKQLGFVWWLVTIHLPLDHIPEVFNGIQVWRLGWPWQGPDVVVLHPHLHWPGCVAWSIVLLEKTLLRVGEHCQSKRKQVFFQDNFVPGLIHASFTKTNLPDSNLAEATPGHHRSSTKFHSRCETLACRPLQVSV